MDHFEEFPQEVQQQIEARDAANKQRGVYIPPGGLPRVTNPMVGTPQYKAKLAANAQNPNGDDAAVASLLGVPVPAVVPELVPNEQLGAPSPSSSADAISLGLPSRFAFYDFKDIYIVPFKGKHLSKLSRAHKEESLLHMVEAVSSVLSNTTNTPNLAFKLTINDFYFVLYWLRTNSYTKSVYTHRDMCKNKSHHEKVAEGSLPNESLISVQTLTKTDLRVTELETLPNPDLYVLNYPGLYLNPTTMQDTLQLAGDPAFAKDDEEFLYSAQLASYLRLEANPDATLRERIAVFNELSVDDVTVIQNYENAITTYGVVESTKLTCKACGASWVSKISLDAHDFLPS